MTYQKGFHLTEFATVFFFVFFDPAKRSHKINSVIFNVFEIVTSTMTTINPVSAGRALARHTLGEPVRDALDVELLASFQGFLQDPLDVLGVISIYNYSFCSGKNNVNFL